MIRIVTDSASGITPEYAAKNNVDVISLYVLRHGEATLETEMDMAAFHENLAEMIDDTPTSSQPAQESFETYFESCARAGDSVVGIFLSSELSGTFGCAFAAAKHIKEKFPHFVCSLIDTQCACQAEMYSVMDAVEARAEGAGHKHVARAALEAVSRSRIMFVPETLEFLIKGGRLNKAAGALASKLKISPIITTINGKALAQEKIRKLTKAIERMFEIYKEDVIKHGLRYVDVAVAGKENLHLESFKEKVGSLVNIVPEVRFVSPVIATHAGPALGISYMCVEKIENKCDNVEDLLVEI